MKFNFPQKYKIIAIILFLGILIFTVHFVFGIERVDEGYKFLPGESKAISAFINGEIKKVALKNSSSADYSFFIPTKTEAEFSSFSSYHPASMSVPAYCNNGNCEVFAGESIYIPKMKSAKIIERNKKIKSEFNGKNLYYLSQKYHICVRQVRRILKT